MADGNQDAPKADEVMRGGPGNETAPAKADTDSGKPPSTPPEQPKMEVVKLEGREFEVPPELAETIRKRERSFEQKISEFGNTHGELQRLREMIEQSKAPPKEEKPESPKWGDRLFEDPDGTINDLVNNHIAQLIEQRINGKVKELTEQQQQQQAEQAFWSGFYGENQDLKDDEWAVRAVFNENLQELGNMAPSVAKAKLADLTRERILRIARRGQSPNPARPVESASPPTSAQEEEAPPSGPASLTASLRERRAKRMEAKRATP